MKCPKCQHENEFGNYCIKCGTPLTENTGSKDDEDFTGNGQQSVQGNHQFESMKQLSKGYFQYFLDVLKNPYREASKFGKEQQINSFITIGLYSIFIPMIIYITLGDLKMWIDQPFFNLFIKPFIGYAIFVLLIALYIFLAIKINKISVSIQDVFSRYGTMLVPFVVIFALAFITSLLEMDIFLFLLFFGFAAVVFLVPPFVLMSFTKGEKVGIDLIYSTLIVYVLTFITIDIMSDLLFSMIGNIIGGLFNTFFPFN
ncbi:zinc ribbon domain-containing protein [Fervidibacillus albus]|uniref:Zinc ribbon domain-containing protein n=1 Tax=Fervidibacillus albus TaxID=2980026 RepID=A0A9E8LUI1_9BACI|nr:zinc ribbon domain-containing protein [Fervidibacillus albus]WAA09756.1 zinc ribbon domain-containing protein [Fervidibacillus albus]